MDRSYVFSLIKRMLKTRYASWRASLPLTYCIELRIYCWNRWENTESCFNADIYRFISNFCRSASLYGFLYHTRKASVRFHRLNCRCVNLPHSLVPLCNEVLFVILWCATWTSVKWCIEPPLASLSRLLCAVFLTPQVCHQVLGNGWKKSLYPPRFHCNIGLSKPLLLPRLPLRLMQNLLSGDKLYTTQEVRIKWNINFMKCESGSLVTVWQFHHLR